MAGSSAAMLKAPGQSQMDSDSDEYSFEGDDPGNICCPDPKSCLLSTVCVPAWLGACKVVNARENAVVLIWGDYAGTITQPGCHCVNPCGTEFRQVSTARQTLDIKDIKCSDSKGNPIFVSGNLAYMVYSAKRACLDVTNVKEYISQQAPMVMRKICSKYPYDSVSGPSLRGHSGDETVSDDLRRVMQVKASDAGVQILQYEITDLSYAPEIAAAMLQKQQAEAMVEARQVVVQSAVDISSSAIKRMKGLGHSITPAGEERIISSLLTVICGDRGAQPTVAV
eukprot:TRINITY_DN103513_c0_g1_i1.p1 TRINITY_DN103513_c0_g1~~TRINITY_DN103513_c0_g1_i1.p1  ORF type:complete len:306 (+),score=53.34 TRINITY_DN103513_c0_g1_i1:74-919(+)